MRSFNRTKERGELFDRLGLYTLSTLAFFIPIMREHLIRPKRRMTSGASHEVPDDKLMSLDQVNPIHMSTAGASAYSESSTDGALSPWLCADFPNSPINL